MKTSLRPALVIALISLPIFLGALDLTVVSAVLPQVVYDLEIPQTEINRAAWIVSGYLLAYTIAMTFMGRLSDLIGRRKVYLLALAIFALGSYLVAVADEWPVRLALRGYYLFFEGRPDPAQVALLLLVTARIVQAFGGGAMVPVGMALASDLFPSENEASIAADAAGRRAQALGTIAAVDTAGWVVGHLYGGIITRYFDWKLIFWLNLPLCALGFALIAILLREQTPKQLAGQMDWSGALWIALSLAAFNLGFASNESVATHESSESLPAYAPPMLLAALLFLLLFIWREARAEFPIVPLRLFRQRNFAAASAANFLIGFCLFIGIANVPLFINTLIAPTLAQGAWDSGWVLSALTVPMALASIPGGWWSDRRGYRWPALVGGMGTIAGFVAMTTWEAAPPAVKNSAYATMILHLVCAGVGIGLTIAPIAAAAINAAPASYRGAASALVIIFRLLGMTLSVSAIASFDQARFNQLSGQFLAKGYDLLQAGTAAITQVISETFWIAAAAALLALIPMMLIHKDKTGNS